VITAPLLVELLLLDVVVDPDELLDDVVMEPDELVPLDEVVADPPAPPPPVLLVDPPLPFVVDPPVPCLPPPPHALAQAASAMQPMPRNTRVRGRFEIPMRSRVNGRGGAAQRGSGPTAARCFALPSGRSC
jgi:hypothetical protein